MPDRKKKKPLVPKLRFPEFKDAGEWTTKELSQLAELISEKAGNKKVILMSVTAGIGLVSQIEKFGREIAGAQHKNYFVIEKNDFAYNKSATKDYPQGFIALYEGDEQAAVPNSIFTCFRVNEDEIVPKFLNYQFLNNLHGQWLQKFITIGARTHGSLNIDNKNLLALPVPLPSGKSSLKEQQKIAESLSPLDELIELETQRCEALKAHKKGLMQQLFPLENETTPRLRFSGFRNVGPWEVKRLGRLIETVTPPKKLKTSDYLDKGRFPVIDQSQDEICGWTNDKEAIIREKFPLVIFGDHTCTVKMSTKPFAQGADGIKILAAKSEIDPRYLYQYLLLSPIEQKQYKRHFSILKEKLVYFPPIDLGEQQKIADSLSSLDKLIELQSRKVEALKQHKKGLMQQLFPQEVI